ncbi:MAG: aldose 1-epimerase [Planctomycetaceae bacterium]|jgi:aldose 1-epimerase
MPDIVLTDPRSSATATILSEAGFNCHSLRIPHAGRVYEILDSEPAFGQSGSIPARSGIPLLFPFPNRIRGSAFVTRDKTWQLTQTRVDVNGHAIHGHVHDRQWRVTRHESHAVVADFHLRRDAPELSGEWPSDYQIEITYQLVNKVLRCDITIHNPDEVPLPWGFGTHTYFKIPLGPGGCTGDILIQAPVGELWELDQNLPTGRRLPLPEDLPLPEGLALAGQKLDQVFGGLRGRDRITTLILDPAEGVEVIQTLSPAFRELVVFTPPHGRSVCLEPYTCVTDAANLQQRGYDSGWQELPPGQETRLWFEITLGPILC